MAEGIGGGGGGGGGGETSGSRQGMSYEAAGGRQRFSVELRPGETTIVSWKKLVKDAAGANNNSNASSRLENAAVGVSGPPQTALSPENLPAVPPSLDARLAPGQNKETDGREVQPVSRLSSVIEKIERLYVGKASSDEEDCNDVVPDDDEYDTEDSFIDDTELDEYFKVDNSEIKHDGFFVNRGKLERNVNEPASLPNQQPKKRRRKDLAKDDGNNDSVSNKHVKVGKKDSKSVPINGKRDINPSQDASNGNSLLQEKYIGQQKVAVPSKDNGNKLREGREFSDPSSERLNDNSSYGHGKSSCGRSFNNVGELSDSIQKREKGGVHARPGTNVTESQNSLQVGKAPPIPRKEGSSARSKSTVLEKAIRDLEKLVSESRPPVEVQDADTHASQAVKRRLPPDIKQKLAKVARLAQASHGKITKELLNRLMSIVGHMIQLRSLKRNLKVMVSMGLSAKQEKDNRVQQVKKEVAEMVRVRIPLMNSKALEQLARTTDDFQESNPEEREAFKRKYSMDDALEDKICYLYDLYVEGLEEDAGPQVRKLYAELAALWPDGFMDNHGIKRAICRAKDRRRAVQARHKDQEKIKRKKVVAPKTKEKDQTETNSTAQPQYNNDKFVSNGSDPGISLTNKSTSSTVTASATAQMPVSFTNGSGGPSADRRPKQEKAKGSSSSSSDTRVTDVPLKKVKRKPETNPMGMQNGEGRQKSRKQVVGPVPKASNLQQQPPVAPKFSTAY